MTRPEIVLIAALSAKNRVIGANGVIPWHFPEDLKRFQQITWGHPIIMGRVTWEFCLKKRILPQRLNIVVSKTLGPSLTTIDDQAGLFAHLNNQLKYRDDSLVLARSLPDAFAYARIHLGAKHSIFVIGGASIYAQTLPFAHRLELTLIEGDFIGDTYFPDYQPILNQFSCVASIPQKSLTYVTYRRHHPSPLHP